MVLGLVLACTAVKAQNPDLEYFAKVPTRYVKPGLKAGQGFHISRMGMPVNNWVTHPMELRFDVAQISLTKRASIILGFGGLLGYDYQKHTLYEVNDSKAVEKNNNYFAAPTLSGGIAYGFFFPYFISFRAGVYYGFEGAYYKAVLPMQISDQDGITVREEEVTYHQALRTGAKPYASLELYRPFKSHFLDKHPMGWSVAYTFYPGVDSEVKQNWKKLSTLNVGFYWHLQTKHKGQ